MMKNPFSSVCGIYVSLFLELIIFVATPSSVFGKSMGAGRPSEDDADAEGGRTSSPTPYYQGIVDYSKKEKCFFPFKEEENSTFVRKINEFCNLTPQPEPGEKTISEKKIQELTKNGKFLCIVMADMLNFICGKTANGDTPMKPLKVTDVHDPDEFCTGLAEDTNVPETNQVRQEVSDAYASFIDIVEQEKGSKGHCRNICKAQGEEFKIHPACIMFKLTSSVWKPLGGGVDTTGETEEKDKSKGTGKSKLVSPMADVASQMMKAKDKRGKKKGGSIPDEEQMDDAKLEVSQEDVKKVEMEQEGSKVKKQDNKDEAQENPPKDETEKKDEHKPNNAEEDSKIKNDKSSPINPKESLKSSTASGAGVQSADPDHENPPPLLSSKGSEPIQNQGSSSSSSSSPTPLNEKPKEEEEPVRKNKETGGTGAGNKGKEKEDTDQKEGAGSSGREDYDDPAVEGNIAPLDGDNTLQQPPQDPLSNRSPNPDGDNFADNDKKKQTFMYNGKSDEERLQESGGFLMYFTILITALGIGFFLFHNKRRILAYLIEGKRPHGSRTRRRSSSTSGPSYRRLENNFE